jgi:hypothetical protein
MKTEEFLADDLARLTDQAWQLENTGGGCSALVLNFLPDVPYGVGHYMMVTHSEDPSVPQPNEPHHLGEYVGVNDINHWRFENRRELMAFLRTWSEDRDTE